MRPAIKIGDVIGAYRVHSHLGSGGMGDVWLAEHELLGRRVAIKCLRSHISHEPESVERFFAEARAAAQLEDPGIVQVHDFGWHAGNGFIIMELLVGESVSVRLEQQRWLPPPVALRIVQQTALTMAVAHGRGIVHRDLKPDNLFLVPDPMVAGGERVKILDFGIAKLVGDDANTTHTRSGVIMGTPMYMSPEQCRGAGGVDHRTDIYALGCVLFHLLCGRPPFLQFAPGDMIAAHLLEEPVAPSSLEDSIAPEIDALVKCCLAKSPDDRFQTMSDLARALASAGGSPIDIATIPPVVRRSTPLDVVRVPTPKVSVAHDAGVGMASTLTTGASSRGSGRTQPWIAVAVALGVAAGLAALVFALRRPDETAAYAALEQRPAIEDASHAPDAGTTVPLHAPDAGTPIHARDTADAAIAPPQPAALVARPKPSPPPRPPPAKAPPPDEDLYDNR